MDQSVGRSPYLAALVALSDHAGRMTDAARALDVPQSTMSRRIHALESSLSVPLLVRDGRGVRLTTQGERLADLARGPLAAIDSAIATVVADGDPEAGTIRFGFPLTMGAGAVPRLLAGFAQQHPRIRWQLRQAHGEALIEDLRRGRLDLAITIPPPDDLPHVVVGRQAIVAAMSDRHPLAVRPSVTLGELEGESFIVTPPAYHLRRITWEWCRGAGFELNASIEVTEFDTVREFVRRDLGVALLPRAHRRVPHLVEVPLAGGDYTRPVGLTTASERLTPAAALLRDFVLARRLVLGDDGDLGG